MSENFSFDVFISYAHEDRVFVPSLAERLKRLGFLPWFAEPGCASEAIEQIKEAVNNSATCILLFGPSDNLPWNNDSFLSAIDARLESSHGEFILIPVSLPGARTTFPPVLPTMKSLRRLQQKIGTFVKFEKTLDEDEATKRLVLRLRGVEPDEQLLWALEGFRNFVSQRARNALNVNWRKLATETLHTFTETYEHDPEEHLESKELSAELALLSSFYGEAAGSSARQIDVANTQIYLLDTNLSPVPIGGAGFSRDCLRHPSPTAEKFIPDPFASVPSSRLYRAGDRALYPPDGQIEFLDRADQQVKIRGLRLEPGEVEAALEAHAGVGECAVVVWEDEPGDKRLVAYVVGAAGADGESAGAPAGEELKAYLRVRLPDYMVPSAFVTLDALPLNANGKVDRRALPAPEPGGVGSEEEYVAPRTPAEEAVANIFAKVLSVERVGIHDNFFDLGGHSLLATQLMSRIRETFKVELPLRLMFESPTVAALAEALKAARQKPVGLESPPIEPVVRGGALPLSFAQQRLWFLDQLEPGGVAYNVPAVLRLTGRLDAEALGRSLTEVVRRHEVLRTSFAAEGGVPVQVISEEAELPLPLTDLSPLGEQEREVEAQRLADAEASRPFDLTRSPLLRAKLLRLGKEEHLLLVTMHHIISDGWSMGVLIKEVSALYAAYTKGEQSPLEELPIQYADFAAWQREWLTGEALEQQLSYWRAQLAGAPPALELPADHPRPAVQSYRGARRFFRVGSEVVAALKRLSERQGCTLFMTLLAAFDVLLYRYTEQQDVVVGSPIAGRNRGETEGLIGFFVNTLALRTDLSGGLTFTELLRKVREVTLGAYAHQDVPFEKLVEELQPERDLSRSPLFQVMFILQNANVGGETVELTDLQVSRVAVEDSAAKFDLTLSTVEVGDDIGGLLEYNADLFDAATAERMLAHFQRLLSAVAANPEQPIERLELMSEEERQRLLYGSNKTSVSYAPPSCVHQLFEE